MRDIHGATYIARQVGLSERQIRNWLAERDKPHPRNRGKAELVATEWTARRLVTSGYHVPADLYGALYLYKKTFLTHDNPAYERTSALPGGIITRPSGHGR
jgi:hypothetical protein